MPSLSPLEERKLGKLKTSIDLISKASIRKLPKVKTLQVKKSAEDCVAMMTACLDSPNALMCSAEMLPNFISCLTGTQETLVTNVPCGEEESGTHYLPYSVYKDWIRCTYEQSGGKAECDEYTYKDEDGRVITTKIGCECSAEKEWDGRGCKCPESAPYDKFSLEEDGGKMINGECCAERLCGEGGLYDCDKNDCECAPGWFDDGEGGCTEDACQPGEGGCADGYCCETIGDCILNDGEWDGKGDPDSPKTMSECEEQQGKWIETDDDVCPQEGHCNLSICNINQTFGGSNPNRFAISECDPFCLADKCALACSEADPSECGGTWKFDSCDNRGTPSTCLCACVI